MKLRDLFDFTLLAALWGASFLFTRIAAPAFGPIVISDLRTAIAALVLLSLLAWRGGVAELAPNALRLLLLGAFNSAIPFTLFAYAAQRMPLTVIGPLNYIVPTINFCLGWMVFHEELPPSRVVGFALVWVGLAIATVDAARRSLIKSTVVEPIPV